MSTAISNSQSVALPGSDCSRKDRLPLQRQHHTTLRGIPLKYLWCEICRPLRRSSLLFNLLLPAVLYLALFRTAPENIQLPNGNFEMWMMLGIAVYGSATASAGCAAAIAIEKASGWMRTMRMTQLSVFGYVLARVIAAMCVAVLPVLVVGVLGVLTGAKASPQVWALGLLTAWAGSAVFSAFGLALGLSIKPDLVAHVPGVTLTGLAFLGNLFLPLSGIVLEIGRLTPMYGVTALARYPLTDGTLFGGEKDSVLWACLNVAAWFAVFSLVAARRLAKGTGRV